MFNVTERQAQSPFQGWNRGSSGPCRGEELQSHWWPVSVNAKQIIEPLRLGKSFKLIKSHHRWTQCKMLDSMRYKIPATPWPVPHDPPGQGVAMLDAL